MEASSFLTVYDRSHAGAEVVSGWMHWAQTLNKYLFSLLRVSIMKQSGPKGCTHLLTWITSVGLQEGGVGVLGGYEKENGTEQKLGTKEDIQEGAQDWELTYTHGGLMSMYGKTNTLL